jgi:hypothetical protein
MVDAKAERKNASLCYGLAAGAVVAVLFNPYDRALYLSVMHRRQFSMRANWASPYQGFLQTFLHRALSGGIYYPLEHHLEHAVPVEGAIGHFAAGSLAGALSASLLSPFSAVKYACWGSETAGRFFHTAARMFEKGGWRPFASGLGPTVGRDAVFGSVYTGVRRTCGSDGLCNTLAAVLATVISSPFNLARNAQFATAPDERPPSTVMTLKQLAKETNELDGLLARAKYVQYRLCWGWGTLRVGLGMSCGAKVYDTLVRYAP